MIKKGHGLPFNLNRFSRMQFIVSFLIFTIFPLKKVPTTNELLVSADNYVSYCKTTWPQETRGSKLCGDARHTNQNEYSILAMAEVLVLHGTFQKDFLEDEMFVVSLGCSWRHGSHAGGQEQKSLPPLVNSMFSYKFCEELCEKKIIC